MDGAIEVQNLQKIYENGLEALKGINLTIKKGETVALVGNSGAGKTTICKYLLKKIVKYQSYVFQSHINQIHNEYQ